MSLDAWIAYQQAAALRRALVKSAAEGSEEESILPALAHGLGVGQQAMGGALTGVGLAGLGNLGLLHLLRRVAPNSAATNIAARIGTVLTPRLGDGAPPFNRLGKLRAALPLLLMTTGMLPLASGAALRSWARSQTEE